MSQNPGTVSHSRVMDVYFAGIYGNNMGFDQSPRKNWGSIQILRHALQFFSRDIPIFCATARLSMVKSKWSVLGINILVAESINFPKKCGHTEGFMTVLRPGVLTLLWNPNYTLFGVSCLDTLW